MPVPVPMYLPSEESTFDSAGLTSDSDSTIDGSTRGTDTDFIRDGEVSSSMFSHEILKQIFDGDLWQDVDDLRAMGDSQEKQVKQLGANLELLQRGIAENKRKWEEYAKLEAAVDERLEVVVRKVRRVEANVAIIRERQASAVTAVEDVAARVSEDIVDGAK
ncbi:hypothetical protein BV25DRAFT_1818247 [Artomyces pyxidatus]|uniref:Uncharacterized protein n=1 Tax=Artomyces pyxidatus TaxID=48021 RepID=A0ACB8TLF5_9AGAM|nr:hypothetical protein BV25DRAFT_1818247 [Artomyces pyxidatus]